MDRYLGLVSAGESGLVIQPLAQADSTGWVAVAPPHLFPIDPLPKRWGWRIIEFF